MYKQVTVGDKNIQCSKLILLYRTKYKFGKKGEELLNFCN